MSIRELDEHDFEGVHIVPEAAVGEPPSNILRRICRRFSLSMEELTGDSREKHITRARNAAYLLLHEAGYSYPSIARIMSYRSKEGHSYPRNTSTPMSGAKRAALLRVTDASYAKALEELKGGRAA